MLMLNYIISLCWPTTHNNVDIFRWLKTSTYLTRPSKYNYTDLQSQQS